MYKVANEVSKNLLTLAVSATMLLSANSFAKDGDDDLTAQDQMVTTIIDKSVISGEIYRNAAGYIEPKDGMLLFNYSGDVYSIGTDDETGELKEM